MVVDYENYKPEPPEPYEEEKKVEIGIGTKIILAIFWVIFIPWAIIWVLFGDLVYLAIAEGAISGFADWLRQLW